MSWYTTSQYACNVSQIWLLVACSYRANISKPASYFTIMQLLTVSQGELPSFQMLMTVLNSKMLNTSLLEVMISSRNECVFVHGLSDLTLQIIPDARCASITVDLKRLLLGLILNILLPGGFILTAGLMSPAALASYVSFVIKYFALD